MSDEFAGAFRGPRTNAYQMVLGKYVNLAVSAPPLKKISYVCQAALMLNEEEREKAGLNIDEVGEVASIAIALDAAIEPRNELESAQIPWPWPRTKENFDKYLRAWLDTSGLEFDQDMPGEFDEVFAFGATEEQVDAQWVVLTRRLSRRSLRAVQTQFVRWTLPKVMTWMAGISRLISPDALLTSGFGMSEFKEGTGRQSNGGKSE